MKKMAKETNMNPSESERKDFEIDLELSSAKNFFSDAGSEINAKEKEIESLQVELREKDSNLKRVSKELNNAKSYETQIRRRIQELETDVEERKNSEVNMHDSLVAQTDQLKQTRMLLQESKFEIASLQEKIEKFETSSKHSDIKSTVPEIGQVESPELSSIKKELKLAIEAEEYSKKAMDELALVLKEVTTEANQVKEKLNVTESELEHVKDEGKQYKEQLNEAKIEINHHENTIKRLRLEAEESLLAWNGRETGFVDCVKKADDEKAILQEENTKLQEILKEAETKNKQSKEENNKLRDILKQAINESTMAKEAACIAQDENSQLKDSLKDKDEQLNNLARENECLKDNEAATLENFKELKKMIFESSSFQEKAQGQAKERKLKKHNSLNKDGKGNKKLSKAFSFNLKDLKMHNKHKDADKESSEDKYSNEDHEDADPLKGSIFDLDSTIDAQPEHTKMKSTLSDSPEMIPYDHEISRRRRLLKKFGNVFIGRSFYRKESSSSLDGSLHR